MQKVIKAVHILKFGTIATPLAPESTFDEKYRTDMNSGFRAHIFVGWPNN